MRVSLGETAVVALIFFALLTGCERIHLIQDPPAIPPAYAASQGNDFNSGRVQAIAISPADARRAIVAMEFGGLWGTINRGDSWFRVFSLPEEMLGDVEFGNDGNTVIATVFRDNQVVNGGGIYVSHDRGGSWTRSPSGVVPPTSSITRTSAYGISRAPDNQGLWYVGTDFGIAISADNGNTWTHKALDPLLQPMVQAVLAFPRGTVLALTSNALYRSDDQGQSWRLVLSDNFSPYFQYGVNKMDRHPDFPWAFILGEYHSTGGANGAGTLWFYELDTGKLTRLTTPQGTSRGPFVRVTREPGPEFGPWPVSVWTGHGWDGYRVTRTTADEFRALTPADWISYVHTAGVHADMSDLGVDGALHPVFLGSDGGIFKLRQPPVAGAGDWVSAAVPGSGMNSLQMTDLAGTNRLRNDGAPISTSLYFSTQDNNIWASADGGRTWPNSDCSEGYDLETRPDVLPGYPATVGYVEIGCNWTEQFADTNLTNQRVIPDVDQNGQPLDTGEMKQAFYLEPSNGGTSTSWLRMRIGGPSNGIYVSTDGGNTWRRRFNLNFGWAGAFERTNIQGGLVAEAMAARTLPGEVVTGGIFRNGIMGWLSVYLSSGQIGLVPLSNLYADRVDTIDDSDAVRLPAGGSLGRRAAQWSSNAVFGADPRNWQFLIAPDIGGGGVKVSRDGGQTWATDHRLTAQVLEGGRLKMRDIDDYHMQVTKIAFDLYHPGRILVGTRDAGVVCSADNGRTWYTITNSDRINYVTGFHFYPNGAVHIGSWGSGLWYLDQTAGCSKTDRPYWLRPFPPEIGPEPDGVLARMATEPPAPRGIADPRIAKLFLWTAYPSSGLASLGPDLKLQIAGRNFPANQQLTLLVRTGGPLAHVLLKQAVSVGRDGTFSSTIQLPKDLPEGTHSITAIGSEGKLLALAEFVKTYAADEGIGREIERSSSIH